MTDPRKQIIGRRSKADGETFERWISNACEFYLSNGWAHIEKTPEPFHITGKTEMELSKGIMRKKDSLIIKEFSVMEQELCSRRNIPTVTELIKVS